MGAGAGDSGAHLSILQNGEQHKIFKIAAQFSTKLAQFFDTIFKLKFAVGRGASSQNFLGDISGRDEAQNLKISAHFSTKLAQFFDTISILERKFAMGLALKTSLGNISGSGAAQNLKIAAQFIIIF